MEKFGWEVLEEKLEEKRKLWTLYPERRNRLEAEAKVLRAGIKFMKRKARNISEEEKLMQNVEETLL